MTKISTDDAYLLFGKWREQDSKLHAAFFEGGNRSAFEASVFDISQFDQTVSLLTVADGLTTRKTFRLTDATFRYEEPLTLTHPPHLGDGKWGAYLFVEFSDGFSALFAERMA